MSLAGGQLSWLLPYRGLYFLCYALGWDRLLRPYDPRRSADLGFLLWVTSVRESIDRLLPVASVGGGVIGVRLLGWRGVPAGPAGATVIVEVLLTLVVSYLFTALGWALLVNVSATGWEVHRVVRALLLLGLPIPVVTGLLLHYGGIFSRVERWLRPLAGASAMSEGAVSLDRELRAILRRGKTLLAAGSLQLAALMSGAFEVWLALRLFGHPVGAGPALMLESLTQAMRHLAFIVPAGLGVQEAGLVLFGQALGISSELALAVSMAKRLREVSLGVPALMSWQWAEARRTASCESF